MADHRYEESAAHGSILGHAAEPPKHGLGRVLQGLRREMRNSPIGYAAGRTFGLGFASRRAATSDWAGLPATGRATLVDATGGLAGGTASGALAAAIPTVCTGGNATAGADAGATGTSGAGFGGSGAAATGCGAAVGADCSRGASASTRWMAGMVAVFATTLAGSVLATGSAFGGLAANITVGGVDIGRNSSSGSAPAPATISVTTAIAPLQNRLSIMLSPRCRNVGTNQPAARRASSRGGANAARLRRCCGTLGTITWPTARRGQRHP